MILNTAYFTKFHFIKDTSFVKTFRLKFLIIVFSILLYFPCLAQTTEYYGTNWGGDGLANTTIGEYEGRQADYRFRAEYSGYVSKLQIYLMYSAGYGSGTGGKLTITLESDDGTVNHFPSGTVLTSVTDNNPMSYGAKGSDGVLYTFESSAKLTRGNLYHLRFTNTDADPINNYISINSLYTESGLTSDAMPTGNITDLAFLRREATKPFQVYTEYTPIFSIYYSDGLIQGQGYIGASIRSPRSINGSGYKVRSNFTVSGADKVINRVSLRLKKISGNDALTVRLEDSGGTLIEQGTIAAANIPTRMTWVPFTFLTSHVLSSGSTYHLSVSTGSGSTYQTFALQDGSNEYGYKAMFPDGCFNYTTNGSTWNFENDFNYKAQIYFSNQVISDSLFIVNSVIENDTPAVLTVVYNISVADVIPATTAFSVMVNSVARKINTVAVSGTEVLLTLVSPVANGDIVTVAYTKPSTNPLQSISGGQAASISPQPVINKVNPTSYAPQTVMISPNPAHNIIDIQIIEPTLIPDFIRIINLTGKIVFQDKLKQDIKDFHIPINLVRGVYIVVMGSVNLIQFTQKLIVE